MKCAQHTAVNAFRQTICAMRDVAHTSSVAETLDHVLAAVRAPCPGRLMRGARSPRHLLTAAITSPAKALPGAQVGMLHLQLPSGSCPD